MASLWLKNGSVIIDEQGDLVLCDSCPCDAEPPPEVTCGSCPGVPMPNVVYASFPGSAGGTCALGIMGSGLPLTYGGIDEFGDHYWEGAEFHYTPDGDPETDTQVYVVIRFTCVLGEFGGYNLRLTGSVLGTHGSCTACDDWISETTDHSLSCGQLESGTGSHDPLFLVSFPTVEVFLDECSEVVTVDVTLVP